MLISPKGVVALANLCQEWQKDAGTEFPECLSIQLLVLYDVCKSLNMNANQTKAVLSDAGLRYVEAYINTPIGTPIQFNYR
jgi:hypothetical protein